MRPFRHLWNLFRRSRLDAELRQEMDTHLALIEEEEPASSAAAARRRVRLRFWDPAVHRKRALDSVVAMELERALKELAWAARRLARTPSVSVTAVLTMTLAIGGTVAMLGVVGRVQFKMFAGPRAALRWLDEHTAPPSLHFVLPSNCAYGRWAPLLPE